MPQFEPPNPDTLAKVLRLELRQGCQDRSAQGGLAAFSLQWLGKAGLAQAQVSRLVKEFEPYASLLPAAREALVLRALEALQAPKAPTAKAPALATAKAKPLPAQAAQPAGPGAPLSPRPLAALPGIGAKRALALKSLGVEDQAGLLHYFPRAWEDRSHLKPVRALLPGEIATVVAVVRGASTFRARRGMAITEVAVQDSQGGTLQAMYFNQPWQQKRFKAGETVVLSGRVERKGLGLQMLNPEAEVLPPGEEPLIHTGRIVPLYPLTRELSQRVVRAAVWQSLGLAGQVRDPLPEGLRRELGLAEYGASLRAIHFPDDFAARDQARSRLAFDELFFIALGMGLRRARMALQPAPALGQDEPLSRALLKALPFTLTGAQQRVWGEIQADLARPKPMHRLIQGDVGCGKTLLAALALARACGLGWQAALMAPTEILAGQHLLTLRRILAPTGIEVRRLMQGQKAKERREVLDHMASGRPMLVVGTQALIQEGVSFGRLGLAVVDEQHRFGVAQRLKLAQKAAVKPHVLVMTATPIPRTLAMTVYGDLDVSVVDELPPGRKPVRTAWVRPAGRAAVWEQVRQELKAGRQAYVVYALVDDSDKLELKAATAQAERLQADIFPEFKVGLLHGRLKGEEKDAVMAEFIAGRLQLLVSTTVIEVGVDVPNASVMVVEDADRFGLAQLHQLRGRVGRGAAQSLCYLLGDPKGDEGRARLEAMQESSDGFVIAERDLELRGPGEFLGLRQSGLPDLKLADLVHDRALLSQARDRAQALLLEDPMLAKPEHEGLLKQVTARFEARLELGEVG
jgi:ATP-dependent DNA helicase RecG